MKVWEVELKEKNTPCRNHFEAPTLDRIHVMAKNCKVAVEKAMQSASFPAVITGVQLVAETNNGVS